jgi:phospholipid/cholesterol/gamma-HCH transport system substrate-binding protein
MRKKGSEIWVGIFVVIGIIFLVLMTLKIEKFQFKKESGYLLNIYFSSATGLDRNSPVRIAGVHVGNVEKVLLDQGKAKVIFRVPSNIKLYRDAKAYIKSEGFLGEKYIEIYPGTPGAPTIEPDGVIAQGAAPMDMDQFLSTVGDLKEDIKGVTKPLSDVLKTVDTKKVERMIDNLEQFSGQLTHFAKDSRETIQKANNAFSRIEDIGEKVNKGEGTLGKLITDEAIYRDAQKTVETAKEALESVKKTADTLKDVSDKIEQGEGTLGKLIQDESLYQEAKETVQSLKEITTKVEKGEGTLGKLVSDDQLMKEAEKTLKKVQKAADGLQEQTPITVLGTIMGIFF